MKKYILFLSLFCLACLTWQCGNDGGDGGNVQPDLPAPTIASFTPTTGSSGTTVTITGTNFSATASSNVVKFNGKTATVTNATTTSITTTVPANAGVGKITVEVAGKTATSASDFAFIRYTTVSTVAGSPGTGSSDGTGASAKFSSPISIVQDTDGNFFVSDFNNYTIRKVTPAGVVTTFAGTAGQTGDTDGTGAAARFRKPAGLCIDASGNLYVGEQNRIRKITPAGVVTTFVGSTNGAIGYSDATGPNARFSDITSLAIDAQGNIYANDAGNDKIRKVTPAGVVTTLSSTIPTSNYTLYMSPQGVLYHAWDSGIGTLNTTTGVSTLLAGSTSNSTIGFVDGTGTDARFNGIRGISMDTENNLYVTDNNTRRIRKVTLAGVVSTLAGSNTQAVTNGAIAQATFFNPYGIVIERTTNAIYLTEIGSGSSVRKID